MSLLEDDTTAGTPRVLIDQPGPQNLIVADWAAATTQGTQRVRNEDSWGQLGPIFAVADGMGGLDAGNLASTMATRTLVSQWLRRPELTPVRVVHEVNDAVRRALAGVQGGGTTLSALRIAHDQATIVHVGDSRVYRVRGGRAELLTRDQNLRTELLAAGIMPRAAGEIGPLRALTSFLGMADADLQIDVRSVALRAGDRLVLCTDGVFDEFDHEPFVRVVARSASDEARASSDAATAAAQLTGQGGRDDATAVVLDIGSAPDPNGGRA